MTLQEYFQQNQKIIEFVKDVTPGHIDKYVGTLDYATARFNTILLKLSQDPLLADKHLGDVQECFEIIQEFYKHTTRLMNWHWLSKPLVKRILHYKGTIHIPKIKFLLQKINN